VISFQDIRSVLGSGTKHWPGFARYYDNSSGATAVAFALGVPAVLAVVGVATDYATMTYKRAELQSAADAGAIAAAKEMSLSQAGKQSAEEAARSYANAQLADRSQAIEIQVEIDKKNGRASVQISENWSPFFSEFVGAGMTPVVVNATASLTGSANVCILTLDRSASKAFEVDSGASITAPDCSVYSNSVSETGMQFDSSTEIKSNLVCSAGGITYSPGHVVPEPTTDCPEISDPLAGRPEPKSGVCVNVKMPITQNRTLLPGTYCNGLHITGKSEVTFMPGEYIVEGDGFLISGQCSAIGHDVGFYLKGADAVLNFTGNSVVEFSGRTEGDMAGLLFFEDRGAPVGREHRIATLLTRELTGTIYLSRGNLRIDPKAKVGESSAYTAIIVNQLELRDGPELILNANYGASAVPVPKGLNVARGVALSK
jgi:Flp pilus assembly protein TadG